MNHKTVLPFSDLPQLHLETQGSVVEVIGVAGAGESYIEVKGNPVQVENVDGVVRLSASWSLGDQRMTLYVPQNLRATLNCDMGKLRVSNMAGCDLTLSSNAGTLDVRDARGRFVLRAHAGEIRAENVGGTFELEASTGSVRLGIVALDPGTHRIHSTMGSVKVDLAPGLDVKIESRTVMGSTRTSYPNNPNAAAHLLLEAELGSVKVREGSSATDARHGDWPDWRRWWATAAAAIERTVMAPATSPAHVSPARTEEPSPELLKILGMVEQGMLSPDQADKLIRAVGDARGQSRSAASSS